MQSTNDTILLSYKLGLISADNALTYSPSPHEMLQMLRSAAREMATAI